MSRDNIPYKFRYLREDGSVITRTFGEKIHSPLNHEEALAEGLDAVFRLATAVQDGVFKRELVTPLHALDIGSLHFNLQEIVEYAFRPDARRGNGAYATPAASSLSLIANIFPAFR